MSLDDLSYDEVKARAIKLAEKRRDVGFFYDLFRHTPAINATADEGGSLGDVSGSLIELVEAAHEVFGAGHVGELEPMFRVRFEQYLVEHGAADA
jgi:hypothetical protein